MKFVDIANSPEQVEKWNARRMKRLQRMSVVMKRESGLLSPRQASALLGTKRNAIREMIKQRELKGYRFLGRAFLSFREVLAKRKNQGGPGKK